MDDPIDVESFSLFEPFLGPVHVPAAYEHVVERLRRSIWLRLLLPGERLPPERALAESLGVSRVTVREALRVLQGEGLVATSRGSGGGTVVQEPQATPEQRRLHLSRSRLQLGHLHELRLAVEPAAASLAAVRATDPDIARLERTQAALSESTGLNTFRQADSAWRPRARTRILLASSRMPAPISSSCSMSPISRFIGRPRGGRTPTFSRPSPRATRRAPLCSWSNTSGRPGLRS